jgi:hypothetical protein
MPDRAEMCRMLAKALAYKAAGKQAAADAAAGDLLAALRVAGISPDPR